MRKPARRTALQVDREQRGSFEDHPLNGFQGLLLVGRSNDVEQPSQ
jgi:hypothetical protein